MPLAAVSQQSFLAFFGTRNRVLHIPRFLQSSEIDPSCLGADSQLRLRLYFPSSSQELFKLPGGCDVAPAKESPADSGEPKTFAEVTKDHELPLYRCWKL